MPKPKKTAETPAAADAPPTKATITRKAPADWAALLGKAAADHWRTLRVTIQIREKLMAGKPAKLDAERAMIKARGLEDVLEAQEVTDPNARAELAEEVKDEGLCEFYRREGKPGLWMPSNQVKACLKENWSVLGFRVEHRGSRGALAEAVFAFGPDPADREWILLRAADADGRAAPDGVDTSVCHTTGPKGPMASIKRNEYLLRPQIVFIVQIARAIEEKLPDDAFAQTLYHASRHGLGANRSQGFGTFDITGVEEIDDWK